MLLGRGDTEAFGDQRRNGAKRDKVTKGVNEAITAMEEGENYSSLKEQLTQQLISGQNRLVLERSAGILCSSVTVTSCVKQPNHV